MRLRLMAFACLASVLALATPAGANAARVHGPHHNHGLTIAAYPNPIMSGDGVIIYGHLTGRAVAGQTIRLYHRVAPRRVYTLIGSTVTNSGGSYQFTRAEGVVTTNRSWFVRAPGLPGHVHSRTVFERVAAQVSLTPSTTSADTRTPVVFSGTVTPNHTHSWVYLQTSVSGIRWKAVARVRLGAGSAYSFSHRFKTPGDRDVRVLFGGDARNISSASDPVSVEIQQAQVPDFTISSSATSIVYHTGSAQISGNLYDPSSTTPDAGVSVRLWGHTAGHRFRPVGLPTTTATDGSYGFTVSPAANTVYQVRTTSGSPRRHTAQLYLGVRDVVSLTASSTAVLLSQRVTFSGVVSPDKAGSLVYLERLGSDGHWQVAKVRRISHASTYSFGWTFGRVGSPQFRVRVPGDHRTLGGVSSAVTVTVSAPPSATA